MIKSFLLSAVSGIYGYVLAAVASAALSAGATYYIVHNANAVEIAGLQLQIANGQTMSVQNALSQLEYFISTMHTAEANYSDDLEAIAKRFDSVDKELKNATSKPLPVDCKPDANRLHALSDAINAANQTNTPVSK